MESQLRVSDTMQETILLTDKTVLIESINDSSCSNDSGIADIKSNHICNFRNLQHRTQHDIAYSSSHWSSESESCTESYTSDDSSGENESTWPNSSNAVSPSMGHSSLHYVPSINATEKPLSKFEGFISNEWPEGWGGELEVLELLLTHGGEFCTDMGVIDLSTPAHVRLDSTKALDLLKNKIMNNKSTLESVAKLVLLNVGELASGDQVKALIEDHCRVLSCKGTKVQIKEVIIKCDEVSTKFVTGDMRWIGDFRSCNNLGAIAVS